MGMAVWTTDFPLANLKHTVSYVSRVQIWEDQKLRSLSVVRVRRRSKIVAPVIPLEPGNAWQQSMIRRPWWRKTGALGILKRVIGANGQGMN